MTIQVGQPVPDFKMTTFDPKKGDFAEFSLEANKKAGRWTVLFFYPADFTFVCATEFNALKGVNPQFEELGATVVTVSTDTQFTHLAWQREEKQLNGVQYLMGADPTGAVSKLFGVYLDGAGLALRGTFIISPDGKLMGSEVNFLNLGRNVEETLRKVQANVYLSKHGDEACPASWKGEGDKTLKPSAKMVGRVDEAMNA
ncbi:MAG: peroxiredoxin [Planctomycetes bacterium]|nr:peroxiredoxin [Planctomycetota bacterium]